jgi:hypothetical protein
MQDNLTCIYRNKAGEVLKNEPCTLDHTIGNLLHYVYQSEENYGHVDIQNQAKPHAKISIFETNITTIGGNRSGVLEVAYEIRIPTSINSLERNLNADIKTYLEKTIDPYQSILLVGYLNHIEIKHLENNLNCYFNYELVREPYHYMVDIYTLIEQANQLEEIILNFEKN